MCELTFTVRNWGKGGWKSLTHDYFLANIFDKLDMKMDSW